MGHGGCAGIYRWFPLHDINECYTYKVRVTGPRGLRDVYDESDAPFYIKEEPYSPPTRELVLPMVDDKSGTVYYNRERETYVIRRDVDPMAGDNIYNECLRGLAVFDISDIPSDATIDSAVLDLSNYSISGRPFGNLRSFRILHVDYEIGFIDDGYEAIRAEAFEAFSHIGTLIYSVWGRPPSQVDITRSVRDAHRNHRFGWPIRMQFVLQTDENGLHDHVDFNSGDDGCVLRIRYHE